MQANNCHHQASGGPNQMWCARPPLCQRRPAGRDFGAGWQLFCGRKSAAAGAQIMIMIIGPEAPLRGLTRGPWPCDVVPGACWPGCLLANSRLFCRARRQFFLLAAKQRLSAPQSSPSKLISGPLAEPRRGTRTNERATARLRQRHSCVAAQSAALMATGEGRPAPPATATLCACTRPGARHSFVVHHRHRRR